LRHDVREPTQFGIGEVIAEVAPAAALEAHAHGLSLTVQAGDVAARVDADRPILTAVVGNLLQNAFKFTRPGTTVTLRSAATVDRVLIEVEDECGGLPEGTTDVLFQPFVQRTRTGQGWGLVWRCAGGAPKSTTVTSPRATCRLTGACLRSLFRACRP
jgi:signal transduction histidine kinase